MIKNIDRAYCISCVKRILGKKGSVLLENPITIEELSIEKDLYYKNHKILTYNIKYPLFSSSHFQLILEQLNLYYRTKALMYEEKDVMNLFQMAKVQYEYLVSNGFPVNRYEIYVSYEVTLNHNCALSIYFDKYEYAGGAHGLTSRESDTWDLKRSKMIYLRNLFPCGLDYSQCIKENIKKQISQIRREESYWFFDDYQELVDKNLKEKSFYLSPEGLIIYFQQYDIAPYASGIPTFLIPYGTCGVKVPSCKSSSR